MGASGVKSDHAEVPSPNSFRIRPKVSREFVESSLSLERIWKFLQEHVKRSKDLGLTVFLHQLRKNDGCANVLVETKARPVKPPVNATTMWSLLKVCGQKGAQPGGWRRRIAFESYRVSFGAF
jgi:hypothetical protein